MKTTILAVALLLAGSSAHADEVRSLGSWKGSGAVYGSDGKQASSFQVELVRERIDARTTETRGTVTLPDGRKLPIEQRMVGSRDAFALTTLRGKGGGYCFGESLCQTYEDAGGGKAYATTIVIDADELRLLTTELQDGKAVRFIRQELGRQD